MRDPRSFALPGVFAFLAAGFAFHVAYVWRWVDCSNEARVQHFRSGAARDRRRRPPSRACDVRPRHLPPRSSLALVLLTALVYGAWGVYVSEVFVD